MASTRQLKHHARFHAAVLRNLFSSSPPPTPPRSSAPTTQEEGDLQDVHRPKKAEEVAADNYYDNNDVENKRNYPSRAQRKRLKLKKLKEKQADAMQAKRYIGPLFPDGFEKERQESDDCISGDSPQQGSSIAEECRPCANKEEEGKDVCDSGEPESLSRMKRRRLAKKKHCDNLPWHPPGGSLFTAEVEGKNIFVKRMT